MYTGEGKVFSFQNPKGGEKKTKGADGARRLVESG